MNTFIDQKLTPKSTSKFLRQEFLSRELNENYYKKIYPY